VLGLRGTAAGNAVPVLLAEQARRLLGERVAVALAVGRPDEGGHDVELPLADLAGLPPEVCEAKVDVELEEIDPGGTLGHGVSVETAPDDNPAGMNRAR
jgi:hypothetical protein